MSTNLQKHYLGIEDGTQANIKIKKIVAQPISRNYNQIK